jgi:hypothetical protein
MTLLYLDPGSGSILLQLLVAALAGLGLLIGSQWAKIKRFFSRMSRKKEIDDEDDDE